MCVGAAPPLEHDAVARDEDGAVDVVAPGRAGIGGRPGAGARGGAAGEWEGRVVCVWIWRACCGGGGL